MVSLWKLKCPTKSRLLKWCALENKVPTWEKGRNGSFFLCMNHDESINHIFISCSYSQTVWEIVSSKFGLECSWQWDVLLDIWDQQCNNRGVRYYKVPPLIGCFFIWVAQNKFTFRDKFIPPKIIIAQSLAILDLLPKLKSSQRNMFIFYASIDKSKPWDFFD